MYLPNLKSFWVANLQSWVRGGRRGLRMVPFVGEFLQALHSNFFSIFTRFRDYCRFCAPTGHFFSTPALVSPNFLMFPWEQVDVLCATNSELRCWANFACNYILIFPTYVVMVRQRYRQMDRRTPSLASIFSGVSDLQGVKISVFPLTLLVIVTTVLPLPRSL